MHAIVTHPGPTTGGGGGGVRARSVGGIPVEIEISSAFSCFLIHKAASRSHQNTQAYVESRINDSDRLQKHRLNAEQSLQQHRHGLILI